MEKYKTISEASKILNVSTETLRRWDNTGKFKSLRHPMNNYRVYTETQLNQLVEEMQLAIPYSIKTSVNKSIYPFFETKKGKLFNEDAIEVMKLIEPKSVDLIFADPPYNIKKAEWDVFSNQKEYINWSLDWIIEAERILKPTGSLYICGFSEILADLKWAASPFFEGCKWLIWFYRNKANLGNDWGRSHESILHFRKSKKIIFNIDAIRIPYNNHTVKYPQRKQAETSQYSNGKKRAELWQPNPLGAKPKDVIEIPTISNSSWEKKYPHPTQKPVELLKKIILSSSHENSLVYDPFGGSGTTYAVAEAFQRRWIGSELSPEYCQITRDRLSDATHLKRIVDYKDQEAINRRQKLRTQ